MSAAMRSTLQTVPESLEVTRGTDPSSGAKTPAKLSSETTKARTTFTYHTPSATNKVSRFEFILFNFKFIINNHK